ncbi:hypothetical protein MtrunA17_Chr4g0048291 [Medicago truncatula]|uniref:At1g61340 n=2 Tax=Medicago truncatula TaxID=3880 RepID=Q2HTZ5_MEDTR|nr:F-box protein At1g61340 [Medicago truncatula]ABD32592.1 At1g61340 [Medicago truncatula]AES90432.1 F-box SKIP27-like protein [Medicago truncatula]RHN62515.1 hypothetical protein MtrunA17_Chr4g0048291 [Medicago truncatula]
MMLRRTVSDMTLGFDTYSYGRALGRKRVVVSNNDEAFESNPVTVPLKRMCSGRFDTISEKSRLEALPQDLLVRVLCGVDHDDLEQLFNVSTTIKEAGEIAKQMHFEFSTPKKSSVAVRSPFDIENGFDDEIEAPNAPLMSKKSKPRLSANKLAGISVSLFA